MLALFFFGLYFAIASSAMIPAAIQYLKNDADYCDALFAANYDSAIMEYNELNEYHAQIADLFAKESRKVAKETPRYKIAA